MGERPEPGESPEISRRVKRFTLVVTVALIFGCNAVLLTGLWASGLDLETMLAKPELFDPANGHCVRVAWVKVTGADGLVKVCTEWLDFSDISGETHALPEGKDLTMSPDGNLYFAGEAADNFRLIALMIFAIVVMASGMWIKRVLIARYHQHLQSVDHHSV